MSISFNDHHGSIGRLGEGQRSGLCSAQVHLSRRRLLGAGSALMMSSLARRLTVAAEQKADSGKPPKSVILLWMEGGPSQLETFDPHPGTKFGGDVGDVATTLKDVRIADTMPRLAEQMHLCSLVRSVVGKEGDHERAIYAMKSGYRPDPTLEHPSIGSILCHADDAGADIPRHISILAGRTAATGGYLGPQFDAFKTGDPLEPVPDVRARVDESRYQRRLDALNNVLEPQFTRGRIRNLQENRTLHLAGTQAARKMMSSDQLTAFDVKEEPQAELDAFGDHPFGRSCLAASRLVEVGVRCVEVTLSGWDSHINNHSLQSSAAGTLDEGIAALLKRLEERGLLESTLVVCGGEFGRTPQINPAGGRDHWIHGFSTLLAGGGIRRGHVHGATGPEPNADKPDAHVESPVTIPDLHATILSTLGLDPTEELDTPIGRPMKRSEGEVIESIIA
ncbi:DUF1501 domain-containing protein [Rhodopirellula europaea]|uniref:DUF1501 domain-containing protein n=1 Tax=Rhodopirellula europaea TaxID=1263866 RepID=UPI003D269896